MLSRQGERHLLDDGLRAAGLALDELADHADGALHRVGPPRDADLPRHALREILQRNETKHDQPKELCETQQICALDAPSQLRDGCAVEQDSLGKQTTMMSVQQGLLH